MLSRQVLELIIAGTLALAVDGIAVGGTASPSGQDNTTPGKSLFERSCAVCHGIDGTGGRGPPLSQVDLPLAPDDIALRKIITNGIPPEMPGGVFFTDADVTVLTAYVRSLGAKGPTQVTGNVDHGAIIFARSGCLGCHIFSGRGLGFGPDLTRIRERRNVEYTRRTVEAPDKLLPPEFLWVKVTMPSGQVFEGIRVNEDTFTLQIKTRTGEIHSLRKTESAQIDRLRNYTPMPSYKEVLTKSELQDLVSYLYTPVREP